MQQWCWDALGISDHSLPEIWRLEDVPQHKHVPDEDASAIWVATSVLVLQTTAR